MADIERYDVGGYYGHGYEDLDPQGFWVSYDDHKRIVDELNQKIQELNDLYEHQCRVHIFDLSN